MAKQLNGLIDRALRDAAAVPALHARVSSGWLELTASLPEWALSSCDDLEGLRLSSQLPGSTRLARHFGDRDPHLRADACIEFVPDLREWLGAACAGFADCLQLFAGSCEGSSQPSLDFARDRPLDFARDRPLDFARDRPVPRPELPGSPADVERACAETGWRAVAGDGRNLRVVIPTRAGSHTAHLESSVHAGARFVVELTDLAGQPEVCRRATAALLMAVSASVRSIKGGLVHCDGATTAVLISALDGPLDRSMDDALSALGVACQLSAREAHALLDERLASEYLALSKGSVEEKSRSSMEVEPCLQ